MLLVTKQFNLDWSLRILSLSINIIFVCRRGLKRQTVILIILLVCVCMLPHCWLPVLLLVRKVSLLFIVFHSPLLSRHIIAGYDSPCLV